MPAGNGVVYVSRLRSHELNKEIAYWNKTLAGPLRDVRMPDGLRGSALRAKLDDLPSPAERKPSYIFQLFSFQSAVSYAVMFVLIVAVFYGVRLGSGGSVIEGRFALPQAAPDQATAQSGNADMSAASDGALRMVPQESEAALFAAPAPDVPETAALFSAATPQPAAGAVPKQKEERPAVGGGGETHHLGEWNGYTVIWRQNDPHDPEKREKPVTVEFIGSQGGEPVFRVDAQALETVTDFRVEDDVLVLIGTAGQNLVVSSFNGLLSFQPAATGTLSLPGSHLSTRLYQNVIYAASRGDAGNIAGDVPVIRLEDSLDTGLCYFGALNVESGESNLVAVTGAGEDVALFDRHAYIYFNRDYGTQKVTGELGVAALKLDALEITLSSVR